EGAHLRSTGSVDNELREHFAFDVGRAKHVRIPWRRGTGYSRDLLLDLELEVRLIGVDLLRRTAYDTLGKTTRDPLTREIVFVGNFLVQIDIGEYVRDLDRCGEHLEALG